MIVEPQYTPAGETQLNFNQPALGENIQIQLPLIVSGHVQLLTGDRIAVVCALLCGDLIRNELKVGKPMSGRVASAIRGFLGSPQLHVMHELTTGQRHHGGLALVIEPDPVINRPRQGMKRQRQIWFSDLPADKAGGVMFTYESVLVSSNSSFFPAPLLHRALAVPVLMAQALGVSRITITPGQADSVTSEELQRVTELLDATELKLTVARKVSS